MPEEFKPGCKRPPINKPQPTADAVEKKSAKEETQKMVAVGKPAPDFTAPAYLQGKFVNISLSELKGKWVVLCFYPGDFTFV